MLNLIVQIIQHISRLFIDFLLQLALQVVSRVPSQQRADKHT